MRGPKPWHHCSFAFLRQRAETMSTVYGIIGMLGSLVISAGMVPQILKIYRTKSAADISISFQLLYMLGLVLLLAYGFGEGLWPVWIPCSLEFVATLTMILMKQYYDRKGFKDPSKHVVEVELGPSSEFSAVITPRNS